MTHAGPRPYSMPEQPTSTGRVLLARAFEHWMALHHGISEAEIEASFDEREDVDRSLRHQVASAARLLGELVASGRLRASGRPFGGGAPLALAPELWEVDDFSRRTATSAMDPHRPFDADAEPTHWIFLDLEDFNSLVEASCGREVAKGGARSARRATIGDVASPPPRASRPDASPRLLRMPEVSRRTGMSRSTIYDRIADGRFPKKVDMDGGMSAWHEHEIDDWIAERLSRG